MGKRLLSFLTICLFSVSMVFAQQKITGVVIERATGEPIVGASVLVKGTQIGAATDINGKFTINNVPKDAKTLSVSYIGMIPTEVACRNGLRILLDSDSKSLSEQIVVAYGSMKKSSFTGSAAEIKADDITAHVAQSVTSALANTTAGVQMTSSNGDPTGASQSIRIRGIGSLSASSSPLIILDGMPYEFSLNTINPQDVESMTVLKDAAASAIYGARGANGVILITSKKGRKQDAEIHFDAKWGSNSRLIPQYDIISDPAEYYETAYRELYNTAIYSGATQAQAYATANKNLLDEKQGGLGYLVYTLPEGENLIGTNFKLNPNAKLGYSDGQYYYTPDDWYNEVYHNSFRQEYNLSVSGATDRLNYYASVGYLQDGGIVNNSSFKRYSAKTNVDYQVKKWFKIGSNVMFTHGDSESPQYYNSSSWASSGSLFHMANNMGPIYPLYVRDADGNIKHYDNGMTMYDSNQTNFMRPGFVGNAVRDNEVNKHKSYRDLFAGNWSAILTPVKGLTLTGNIGVSVSNTRSNSLYSAFGSYASTDGGAAVSNTRTYTVNNQYLANYSTSFAEDTHHLDVLVGYEQYKLKSQYLYGYGTRLYDPRVGELDNSCAPGDERTISSYTNEYMTEGILSRLNYDYLEKYFLSASYRRDASSRFAPGHRWGNFYSVSAAWNLGKEKFLEDVSWIDILKLRVSYGELGNDGIGGDYNDYFAYSDIYTASYNPETKEYSTVLKQKGNDDLTWEKIRNFNVGVDFGFWKGRLSGSIEFFNRVTSDLLYFKPTPLSAGIATGRYPVNVGSVRNTGVELQLNATPIRTKDIVWDLNLNLTHYKNVITALDESVAEKGVKYSNSILRVGGSAYEAYLYKFAGIYTQDNYCDKTFDPLKQGAPMFYQDVLDDDGNYKETIKTTDFSNATQYDCGDVLPALQGGIGTSLKVYGFDIAAQFGFQLGGKIYDGQYQALMHTDATTVGSAWHKDALKAWSPENANSNIPRLTAEHTMGQSAIDMYQVSSNYLSLNNVSVGYTVPKLLCSRFGVEALRFYVAGENLFVLSARKGLDPRFNFGIGSMTSGTGYASGNYATMRSLTAGITLTF